MSNKESVIQISTLPGSPVDNKYKPNVTVTAMDASEQRPVHRLQGRRKTTEDFSASSPESQRVGYDGGEDTLTKVGNFLYKIHSFSIVTRYALYVLPVAGLLGIPLILFDTVYKAARIQNIRLLGLFVWLEIVWASLWVGKLCAKTLPFIFQAACGLISTGIRKYSLVLMALEIPISLVIWSIVAWGTVPVICSFDSQHCGDAWVTILHKAMLATIAVTAIFLAEKFFVQLVSINYHRKEFDAKIRESKRTIHILDLMYEASRELFPSFCREFEEQDYQIHDTDTSGVNRKLTKAGIRTKVFKDVGRVRDKVTAAFGNMASEISGKQVFNPTAAHSIVIGALETRRASKALARRLWVSFVAEGKDALYKQDIIDVLGSNRVEEAEEIFAALDKDCNGDVSLEEMVMLVVEVGMERRNRATSMHDISQAIEVLDRLLSLAVLVGIAFVYAAFFSPSFASRTTQLWSAFTGLAFAIGGTVTEFLGCCIFLFVKHPYDVGDRVDIDKVELIVQHVSLMYSVFRRVDSDKSVQIPHNVANRLWIENVSRSMAMKERLDIAVCAGTSSADILALREELEKFVTAPENKRDFQPELNIELISVGDMKQLDLRVEIRHKSNFSNELLRATRRNKFMCELLASMRRIPIEPPGGASRPLGEACNPAYSVAVSDMEARAARAKHDAEKEAKRLQPSGSALPGFMPEAVSTALAQPALNMISTVKGRQGSVVSSSGAGGGDAGLLVGQRRSTESSRVSRDVGGRGSSAVEVGKEVSKQHGPVTYLAPPHR
ncbi:hypothetical protein LTR66_003052 [Elasticomyces elasticus]|nr:hypothetical protein LTR66_003052 [Elasticomyces elasticus]